MHWGQIANDIRPVYSAATAAAANTGITLRLSLWATINVEFYDLHL